MGSPLKNSLGDVTRVDTSQWVEMTLTARGIALSDAAKVPTLCNPQKWPICRARLRRRCWVEKKEKESGHCSASSPVCFQFDTLVEQTVCLMPTSLGQTQSSSTSRHMFSVLADDRNFNSCRKTFDGRAWGLSARLQMGRMGRLSQRLARTSSQTPWCCKLPNTNRLLL